MDHFWKKDLLHCGLITFKSKQFVDINNTEAAARRCSVKKYLLKISQNSQQNTCARVIFKKSHRAGNFITRKIQHRCFPVNFAKIFQNSYFEKHLRTAASQYKFVSLSATY